jgi:DNA-binding FadR family transcriptional regulator
MAPEAVTAERVYARLKAELMAGRYPLGSILVTQAIADEYGTSISPVRDSQQRLIGEQMLEAQPGGGFQLPDMTAAKLRDLYSWHDQLIGLALRQSRHAHTFALSVLPPAAPPAAIAEATALLFAELTSDADNGELRNAIASASTRLHMVRLYETHLIAGVATELEAIRECALHGPRTALRDTIKAYHRRRLRRIDRLHAALHNPQFARDP